MFSLGRFEGWFRSLKFFWRSLKIH